MPRKVPLIHDDCFWNVNENLDIYLNDCGLEQMDKKIELKALLRHILVFKKAYYSYFPLNRE